MVLLYEVVMVQYSYFRSLCEKKNIKLQYIICKTCHLIETSKTFKRTNWRLHH